MSGMFGFYEWCLVLAAALFASIAGLFVLIANFFVPEAIPWPWWGIAAFTGGSLLLGLLAFALAVINRLYEIGYFTAAEHRQNRSRMAQNAVSGPSGIQSGVWGRKRP